MFLINLFGNWLDDFRISQNKVVIDALRAQFVAELAAQQPEAAPSGTPEDVQEEFRRLLLKEMERRGDLSKVQACPTSFGEVVDESEAKPVILSPAHSHRIVM